MRSLVVLGIVGVLWALPACKGGKKDPDCKAAAKNYAHLLIEQIERDNPSEGERRAKAMSLVPSLKDQMIQSCEDAKWDKVVRRCLAEAKRQEDMRRCMPSKGDSQVPAKQAPSRETKKSSEPPPTDSTEPTE